MFFSSVVFQVFVLCVSVRVCVYVVFVGFVYLLSLHVRCVNMLNICVGVCVCVCVCVCSVCVYVVRVIVLCIVFGVFV